MKEVYLLLGSNEGNRIENFNKASELIELRYGKIICSSSIYETEAWGLKEQNAFLNQAVMIQTSLPALLLLTKLKAIESETGRTETVKWGPRVIDIDILFYGNDIVKLPELTIPHPYLHLRRFTLTPLNEIAKEFVHPVLQKTVTTLLKECKDSSEVIQILNSES